VSSRADVEPADRPDGGLPSLLDLGSGFFVWAVHFLVVYVTAAVACVLGLGVAGSAARAVLVTVLIVITLAAAAVNAMYSVRRYRRDHGATERRFRMGVTLGGDAIATVAIVWQLFPLLLVPPCA
jgi:hypothetical protein